METTTVERVAELYEKSTNLLQELSYLTGCEKFDFGICRRYRDGFITNNGFLGYSSLSSPFLAEIKKLTEAHIKQQIEEIDKELEEL